MVACTTYTELDIATEKLDYFERNFIKPWIKHVLNASTWKLTVTILRPSYSWMNTDVWDSMFHLEEFAIDIRDECRLFQMVQWCLRCTILWCNGFEGLWSTLTSCGASKWTTTFETALIYKIEFQQTLGFDLKFYYNQNIYISRELNVHFDISTTLWLWFYASNAVYFSEFAVRGRRILKHM